MYFIGAGVRQDYIEASKWFLKSAEQGYSQGEANTGVTYATGRGVSLNYIEAYKWLSLAAAQDDAGSAEAKERLRKIMTLTQVQEGERRARIKEVAFRKEVFK